MVDQTGQSTAPVLQTGTPLLLPRAIAHARATAYAAASCRRYMPPPVATRLPIVGPLPSQALPKAADRATSSTSLSASSPWAPPRGPDRLSAIACRRFAFTPIIGCPQLLLRSSHRPSPPSTMATTTKAAGCHHCFLLPLSSLFPGAAHARRNSCPSPPATAPPSHLPPSLYPCISHSCRVPHLSHPWQPTIFSASIRPSHAVGRSEKPPTIGDRPWLPPLSSLVPPPLAPAALAAPPQVRHGHHLHGKSKPETLAIGQAPPSSPHSHLLLHPSCLQAAMVATIPPSLPLQGTPKTISPSPSSLPSSPPSFWQMPIHPCPSSP